MSEIEFEQEEEAALVLFSAKFFRFFNRLSEQFCMGGQ
jgi:hypothetical protein